jgi:SAM-dependent MidA family methyltransferase
MSNSNAVLSEIIAQQIIASPQHRITFADYMDLVLYHPQQGYYMTQAQEIGIQGDFMTAPHFGSDFGELLATQFVQMWERLEQPNPFILLEMGAGQGLLTLHILGYLRAHASACWEATQYWIVERSAPLIDQQQELLRDFPVQWLRWEEILSQSIVGCCFSNELVDAFPVHSFVINDGKLHEVYVTLHSDQQHGISFREVIAEPSSPRLLDYFDLLGVDTTQFPEGYRSEINLAALDWLVTVSDRLERGYLLTIDYGYPAHRYYSQARREGTLQCYYQQAHHSNPYIYVGHQDLTAHVNFTALQHQGVRCGLQPIGFVEQGLFLMALGLGDRIAALSQDADEITPTEIQQRLRRRQFLHTLIDPFGLGNFGVLIQGKGLTLDQISQPLQGLICHAV